MPLPEVSGPFWTGQRLQEGLDAGDGRWRRDWRCRGRG